MRGPLTRLEGRRGQGLVEYALILLLVTVAVVVALTAADNQLGPIFNAVKNSLVT